MRILWRTLTGWYCDGHMLGRCARCYPENYTPGKVHRWLVWWWDQWYFCVINPKANVYASSCDICGQTNYFGRCNPIKHRFFT